LSNMSPDRARSRRFQSQSIRASLVFHIPLNRPGIAGGSIF